MSKCDKFQLARLYQCLPVICLHSRHILCAYPLNVHLVTFPLTSQQALLEMELEDEELEAQEKEERMRKLEELRLESEKRNREMSAAEVVDQLFGEVGGQDDDTAPSQFAVSFLQR